MRKIAIVLTIAALLLSGQAPRWNSLQRMNKTGTGDSTIWRYQDGPVTCYMVETKSQVYGEIVIPAISCVVLK